MRRSGETDSKNETCDEGAFVAATITLFATRTSRAADILTDWLGETYTGVIHGDRARMYWSFGRLQWCWAHTIRTQSLIPFLWP
jgi:hypothetical protein